jgi:phosphopantothenoylcysteine decarboxylase / phosphopantothenate---cysteine ligase
LARPALVVGFAAETEDVIDNARRTLHNKKCDIIVADNVAAGAGIFGGQSNVVKLVTETGVESWPQLTKQAVATRLIDRIVAMLHDKQ